MARDYTAPLTREHHFLIDQIDRIVEALENNNKLLKKILEEREPAPAPTTKESETAPTTKVKAKGK